MKSVGQLLHSERNKQRLSLEEVAKATRIRVQYLKALEADEYKALPSATYTKGFIKNYAHYLGLPSTTLLAVFRRDFQETESGEILPRSMTDVGRPTDAWWTPRMTWGVLIGFIVVIFVGFLGYQSLSLLQPKLVVDTPLDGEVVLAPNVRVAGITDPDAVLTINDQLAIVNEDGTFELILQMTEGQKNLVIQSTNRRDYQTTVERQILVKESER